jgi:hypothetical protein
VKTRTELGALVATGALVAAAAWIRLRGLQVSPYPTGVDGYWYLIQVRALLDQGRLYYPSAPLVPCLMAGLSLIFDPVLAVKVFVNASSPWISAASTMRYSVNAARPARTRPNKEGINNEDATMLSRDCSSLGYHGRCSSRSIVGRN